MCIRDRCESGSAFTIKTGGTAAGNERLRIDGSGRLIVGDTANRLVWGINPHLQVNGTDWDDTSIAIHNFGNNTRRPTLLFTKGKSGTLGNFGTSPAAGDGLGIIGWSAHDTTDAENLACYIQGITEQVVTANNQYGAITFSTVNGGTTAYERLRIAANGTSTFDVGAPSSSNKVIGRFQAQSSRQLDIVWHDTGSLMGFDTPGNHSYIFKVNGTEKVRITSSSVTINGSTDGVLNLNTTDARGSFIRFQQAGNTRCWVGSGHGMGLGDDDDLGLMATDKIIHKKELFAIQIIAEEWGKFLPKDE